MSVRATVPSKSALEESMRPDHHPWHYFQRICPSRTGRAQDSLAAVPFSFVLGCLDSGRCWLWCVVVAVGGVGSAVAIALAAMV